MPKMGVHTMILEEACTARPASAALDVVRRNQGWGNLGAIGPDLFFFSTEYAAFDKMLTIAQNLQRIYSYYEDIRDAVNAFLDPIKKVVKNLAERIPGMYCAVGAYNTIKQAVTTFKEAITLKIFDGVAGLAGLNVTHFDQLQSASHKFFDQFFTPGHQKGLPEKDWLWFDMLHYRNTGLFARNLVQLAGSDDQKRAFAYGYLSHLGTDVIGHAYVNRVVGCGYRSHPQRHCAVENFIDSWAWAKKYGLEPSVTIKDKLLGPMSASQGVCKVSQNNATFDGRVVDLLHQAFRKTYAHSQGRPVAYLSPDEIQKTLQNFWTTADLMLGKGFLEKPELPPGVGSWLNEILAGLPKPPKKPSGSFKLCDPLDFECIAEGVKNAIEWAEWIGEMILYGLDVAAKLLTDLINAPCTWAFGKIQAALYQIQMSNYEAFCRMHFALAVAGIVAPVPEMAVNDEQSRYFTEAILIHTTRGQHNESAVSTQYPQHDSDVSALEVPNEGPELPSTVFPVNPRPGQPEYRRAANPHWYIRDAPFNSSTPAIIEEYARARKPAETRMLASQHKDMGNARDFSIWLIESAHARTRENIVYCNWDLDADRGYGYKQWKTNLTPKSSYNLADERYCRYVAPGSWIDGIDEV